MRKRGPPQPGTSRQLTKGEASVLGCSVSWHLVSQPDGLWLMKPWRREEWSGPGPRLSVVRMAPAVMARMRAALEHFWEGRRVILSAKDAERILVAVESVPQTPELEWAANRLRSNH
jgi:hypothetical protein